MKIDEEFCKFISKEMFKVYVVRAEDSKIMQEITLDYSQFLMYPEDKLSLKYQNYKMKII